MMCRRKSNFLYRSKAMGLDSRPSLFGFEVLNLELAPSQRRRLVKNKIMQQGCINDRGTEKIARSMESSVSHCC